MDRASKLRKLSELRSRLPFVSQGALASLLKVAQEEGLPESCGRRGIRESRDAIVNTQTPYGTLHQSVVIDDTTIEVLHPFASLWHAANKCAAFAPLLDRASKHAQPWNIILYADEVLPGNQLAHKHARKTWCWYWTVAEFGPAALSSEEMA